MKCKFKHPQDVAFWTHLVDSPPSRLDGSRKVGASVWDAFWKGYDGSVPAANVPKSAVYIAWRAGQERRRRDDKARQTLIKVIGFVP